MAEVKKNPNALKVMLILACFVIIIAGMKAAKDILVPFLFSVFLSIITSTLLYWLNRKKIPMVVSLLIVILCVLGAVFLLVLLFKSSLNDFTQSLPLYQEKLRSLIVIASKFLGRYGIDFSENQIMEYIDPGAAMRFASVMLAQLKSLLSNAFVIILTVIFIMFEAASLPAKMNTTLKGSRFTFAHIKEIMENINHYMVIKTYMSLATGVLVTVWLTILGIDYPFLWGLLAAIAIFAVIFVIELALIQLGHEPEDLSNIPDIQRLFSPVTMFLLVGTQPIGEEIFFRGFLFDKIEKFSGGVIAIVITSVLFGIAHMSYGKIFPAVMPIFMGMILGYIVYKTQNLYSAIIAHVTFNLTSLTLAYLAQELLEQASLIL